MSRPLSRPLPPAGGGRLPGSQVSNRIRTSSNVEAPSTAAPSPKAQGSAPGRQETPSPPGRNPPAPPQNTNPAMSATSSLYAHTSCHISYKHFRPGVRYFPPPKFLCSVRQGEGLRTPSGPQPPQPPPKEPTSSPPPSAFIARQLQACYYLPRGRSIHAWICWRKVMGDSGWGVE